MLSERIRCGLKFGCQSVLTNMNNRAGSTPCPVSTVGNAVPSLSEGPKDELLQRLNAKARLAYDGETWLVPGLPEVQTEDAAMEAHGRVEVATGEPIALPDDVIQCVVYALTTLAVTSVIEHVHVTAVYNAAGVHLWPPK